MASALSRRAADIEAAIALIGHFHERLRFLQPTTRSLVESAAALPRLKKCGYLNACRERMRQGLPFPDAWRAGLAEQPGALGDEERALLLSLAEALGCTNLESQLSTLEYTREQLEHRLALARRDNEKHSKLYGTLGVLAGLMIVIILV